ncbi:synaptic vesicle 2-related protein [Parasteatoda tepidariorum]|nr:synaptic vesicle 2-related protein [Parasteatoda tepidariorum]
MDVNETKIQNENHSEKNKLNNREEICIDDIKGSTFSVDDAVEKAGYGRFQIRLLCLAGLGWFADAAEIFILSVIGDFLSCDWELQRWQLAMLTSLVFAGTMIGSPAFGTLADKYGRKRSLSVATPLLFVFGALSAASPSYVWLVVFRFLMGFALGGMTQGLTLCSEYCPTKMRGRAGFYLCYFWSFGTISVVLLSWVVMEFLSNWRILLAITSLPAFIVVISLKWYPESSRYYVVSNQHEKAIKILDKMAKCNNTVAPPGELEELKETAVRGRLQDLLNQKLRKTTLIFWYIWFATAFAYYGIALLTPIIIQKGGLTTNENSASSIVNGTDDVTMSKIIPCTKLTRQNYIDLLWTSSAEFPGLVLFTFLVECCSRKLLLGGACAFSGVMIFLLLLKTKKIIILVFLFGARSILLSVFQLILIMTSEVFPTTVRALAMGTGSAFARLGGLIVPYIAQVMIISQPLATICVLAGVTIICAVAAAFIPETKGERLKETIELT